KLMFEGPEEDLTATQNTQPAILAHSAAVFAIVGTKASEPVAAAGHSLGEYSAYVTAAALAAPEAAKLVRRRGELMQKAGEERPGTMAAVLGLATAEAVKDAGRARRLLTDQLTAAACWLECMEHAARLGGEDARFVEIGPGAVLAGLLKRIVPEANVVSLGTADEVTKFMEAA